MASKTRINELDSLRGLAALTVFLLHLKLIFPSGGPLSNMFDYGWLRPFILGQEAVILFFVLSGFVLSIPFHEGKKIPYTTYITRRFCRIYIPYFMIIMLSVAAKQWLFNGNISTLNPWFNSFWYMSVTPQILFEHVFMIKAFGSNLNPIIWSLVYEMRISLLFPFILFALRNASIGKSLMIALACSLISVDMVWSLHPSELMIDYIYTLHYTSLFIIGSTVARNRIYLLEKFSNLNRIPKFILTFITIGFFIYSCAPYSFIDYKNTEVWFYFTVLRSWLVAGGAVLLILLAMSSDRLKSFLNIPPVAFLGKISYSLYLVHFIVFLAMLRKLHDKMPLVAIVGLSLVAGITAAAVLYYLVEKPSMKLGRFLTKKKNPGIQPG